VVRLNARLSQNGHSQDREEYVTIILRFISGKGAVRIRGRENRHSMHSVQVQAFLLGMLDLRGLIPEICLPS
jgi:hypothetical protein